MGLGIPMFKMQHIAAAGGIGAIVVRIRARGHPKDFLPATATMQTEGVLHRVSDFVAQEANASSSCPPLDLEHVLPLEPHQARMREIKGKRHSGHSLGREPLLRQPEMRAHTEITRGELRTDRANGLREAATLEIQAEVA